MLYARISRSYGTSTDFVFLSNTQQGGRMRPVSSATHFILNSLISHGATGMSTTGMRARDLAALDDIEGLGIRLDRKHRAGRVYLRSNVDVIDQRTSSSEAA